MYINNLIYYNNKWKNHIWKCEFQDKNLDWVIKKHKYIELNHKKQIKELESKLLIYI